MSQSGLRVLVIGIARIGDTLLLTPCLRAIKTAIPDAHLTVFSHPKRCSILENFEPIDHLVGMTKRHVLFKGWLPGKDYDVAFVYGRDTALLNFALRTSTKVFCFDEGVYLGIQSPALTKIGIPPHKSKRAVDERMMLVNGFIGHSESRDCRLGVTITEAEQQWAANWLSQAGITQRPLIGLQTCSFPTKAHRDWPAQNFHELIAKLLLDYPTAQFLILGDQIAAEKGHAFRAEFPSNVTIAAGQMNLRRSTALMSQLDLYVGVDTGPTHIAGALGIPMVAMYHHKYWGRNLMPIDNPLCRAIEHPDTGTANATSGMEAITVKQVLDHANELLHQRFAPAI